MAGCSLATAVNPSGGDGALGWVEERLERGEKRERRNPSGRCERGVKAHTTIEIFSLWFSLAFISFSPVPIFVLSYAWRRFIWPINGPPPPELRRYRSS
jgi:hypothetical protein